MGDRQSEPLNTPILRELPGVFQSQPPAAAGTNLALLPLNSYTDLWVYFTIAGVAATRAQIVTQLSQVRIVLSGREIWIGTGAQLIALAAFYASNDVNTTIPGFLSINFLRTWMNGAVERLSSILGTADQSALQIEFTWAGGSTINGSAMYGGYLAQGEATGITTRVFRVSPNISAIGISVFPDLPVPRTGDVLLAMHLFPPVVANLTRVAYLADNQRIVDAIPAALDRSYLEAHAFRTPQSVAGGMVSIDFTCRTGSPVDGIDMSKIAAHQLELTFATAAPGSFSLLCEFASPMPAGR